MIKNILKNYGPCSSSTVLKKMEEETSLSSVLIRQKISRAIKRGEINRLQLIKFKHNASFLFLPDQLNTDLYWQNFLEELNQNNSAYGNFINAIIARGGIILKEHFTIITGCPNFFKDNLSISGHINSQNLLDNLFLSNIVSEIDIDGIGICLILNNYPDTISIAEFKSRLLLERIFLKAFEDKFKKLGLISFNKAEIRFENDSKNEFGSFCWDFTAPSYIQPLARLKKNKVLLQGSVVADINLFNEVKKEQVKYFIKKCEVIRSINNMPNFLPIFVASFFDKEAFNYGKSKNIIFTTPDNILSDGINSELSELLNCLNNAATIAATDVDKFLDIFSNFNKIEGAALNLKGYLMEFIYAHCLKELENGTIYMHREVRSKEFLKKYEIDIIRTTSEKNIFIYECKGYNSKNKIDKNYVEKWVNEIIPVVRNYLENHPDWRDYKQHYEIVTTSDFEEDALNYLIEKCNNTKRFIITYKNGKDFYKYASKIKSKKITEIIKEQYQLL